MAIRYLSASTAFLIACVALFATSCVVKETVENIFTDAKSVGAPSFEAESFSHGHIALADLSGKPVVINFWFPSCPPCRAELGGFEWAYKHFSPVGIEFIGVQQLGLDSAVDGQRFLEELVITYPNIPDINNTIQRDYKVLYYPTTFFLDVNHNIARKWVGQIERKDLLEILNQLTTYYPTGNAESNNKFTDP